MATLYVTDEQLDRIVADELLKAMQSAHSACRELLDMEELLQDYQKKDLADDVQFLTAAKIVYKWFSVNHSPMGQFKL